jgi:hypothetical protein
MDAKIVGGRGQQYFDGHRRHQEKIWVPESQGV